MNALTATAPRHWVTSPRRPIPDLRGPLVAALVVAMITTVSTLIPSPSADRTDATSAEASAAATAAAASQSQLVQAGEVPDGLSATEWTDIQRQIAAAEAVEAVPATVSRSAATVAASPAASPATASAIGGFAAPQIVSSTTVARLASLCVKMRSG